MSKAGVLFYFKFHSNQLLGSNQEKMSFNKFSVVGKVIILIKDKDKSTVISLRDAS